MVHATPLAANLANLVHMDKNVRIEAALALGTLADPAAVPALVARLGVEPDFFVGENVTWALVRMGADAVLPVVAVLQGGDAAMRLHAAHTLSKLGDARAVPALVDALRDREEAVVQKVVYALGSLADMRALPSLVAMVGRGEGAFRGAVSEAVGAFGAAAVPALAALLQSPTAQEGVVLRTEVAEILGTIGVEAVVPVLGVLLDDPAWEVRFAAVNALRRLDSPHVVGLLMPAREDRHPHVAALASRVVRELT